MTPSAARARTGARRDVVDRLRDAGDHPLMTSFPQGAVFAFDTDLRYLAGGGEGLADVGLSREMLEGRTIFEVFDEETARLIEPLYRAALEGEPTSWDVPYEGRIYLQRLNGVRDPDTGDIVAGIGFTQDVTEARAAERALRESEERNRLTLEHAPIGMAIVELDGRFRHVNRALVELTGYAEDRLLALTFQDITHPDDLQLDLDHLGRLLFGEIGSYQIEKRYLTAEGRIVWVELAVSLVRDEAGQPLYFVSQINDITDRKRQHQALADLTAMLAHDLRTPVTVAQGFAELIASAPDDPQLVRSHAMRVLQAARGLTDLLDNALATTDLDAGQVQPRAARLTVRDAVDRALSQVTLGDRAVDTGGVGDEPLWVDPTHLVHVLTNLLTNAAKYGGPTITISSEALEPEGANPRVRIWLADDGPGVPADFVPHLFDRYSRADDARRDGVRGSGLGLSIVRDLLAANGADVAYDTGPDGGACFVLTLPSPRPSPDNGEGPRTS